MNPWGPFVVFIVLGVAWTSVWTWAVIRASASPAPYDAIYARGGALRRALFPVLTVVLAVAFLASIRWFPYPGLAEARLGPPTVQVAVTSKLWQWTMSQTHVPAGTPVEFSVTSVDVNHGFGIYDPSGHLMAQVQAMPGYTNHLVVRFSRPGQYLVRCLEYCGNPHIAMITVLDVQ